MDCALLGWPEDGPTLRLDWRRFAYAGKFVMTTTGKAVVRDSDAGRRVDERDGEFDDEFDDKFEEGDGEFDDEFNCEFDDAVLAAAAFNEDRTDPTALWLRYVTVRADRRGEGIGPRLCAFVADRAAARGYDRVRIAVNNPFAYEALYKAGFEFTGETTGIAELVLERPGERVAERSTDRYRAGLDRYRERDLSDVETEFLGRKEGATPPDVVGDVD